jgi:hypothetical protein
LNKVSELIKKIYASKDNAWEAKLLHNYYRPYYLSYISLCGYLMFQLTLLSVTAEERALLEQDESNQIYGFVDLADIENLLEKLFSEGGIEIPGNWEYIKEGIGIVLSSQR